MIFLQLLHILHKIKVMKKLYLLLMLIPVLTDAQVTINVTSIPSNTPPDAVIYLAGNINTWNPGDPNYTLQNIGNGTYQIIIPEATGTVNYKFTRGSWATVEGNATGGFLPDRSFTFTGSPQTLNLTIQSWEDLGGSGSNSTAAENVQILDEDFFIPQLNATRRIWLYLPPDYATSDKNYPVLYMQDGQNLFDNATSFSGEWEVDETLNELFANGDFGAIVVGIDNGGATRLDEYSPWINPEYGGGDGDAYVDFLAETLKPFIDANYRTRPEPQFNAIIGSSMGGLIATYGALAHPEAFGKLGAMSPSFWFPDNQLLDYIAGYPNTLEGLRTYFVASMNESASMVPDIVEVIEILNGKGLTEENTNWAFTSYGAHNEAYWRGEFSEMYQVLFANEMLAIQEVQHEGVVIRQLNSGLIVVSGLPETTICTLYGLSGCEILEMSLTDGIYQLPDQIPQGMYILKSNNNSIKPVRLMR